MSGDAVQNPEVRLAGASMLALVHAIPEVERRAGKPATVIGGLAVICRLEVTVSVGSRSVKAA